jgi:hypothetical protein
MAAVAGTHVSQANPPSRITVIHTTAAPQVIRIPAVLIIRARHIPAVDIPVAAAIKRQTTMAPG